jgi:retron-type reverse transcriptase
MSRLLTILSFETGLSFDDLTRIIRTAPRRYKVFHIAKRSGGERGIAQPAREVKLLQRVMLDRVLSNLPIHPAARAYRQGVSIRDNALEHAGSGPILKMDFRDFFPSIRSEDWEWFCDKNSLFDSSDRQMSANILFRKAKRDRILRLSIGAPSSPMVSNVLMYQFDDVVAGAAATKGIRYTRYADDITFSGQRAGMLKDMLKVVEQAVSSMARPRLHVNVEKTTFVTPKWRRTVTGVILANNGTLSLGRDRKRLISAMTHHAMLGKLAPKEISELTGFLGFANSVEPEFIDRLRRKYGADLIARIQKAAALRSQ